MHGRHHNTFYYFRGPSKTTASDEAEAERQHRQVEDNTTKALINLLEHSDRTLTSSFMDQFVLAVSPHDATDAEYFLQGGPTSPPSQTALLGLSMLGEIDPASVEAAPGGGSRVDAAIHLPGQALVLVEVKVIEYLDYQQLKRHAERWKLPILSSDTTEWPDGAAWRLAPWADVYRWAREIRDEVSDPVSRFLIEQFLEYLEIVGLAPFGGFRGEHFAFFGLPSNQRAWDTQAEIKARLRAAWEAILEQLDPADIRRLGEIHSGQVALDATAAATQTNWGEEGVNLTVELTAEELQVNLVGWTDDQAQLLEGWIAPTGDVQPRNEFAAYELAVFRRRPHNYAQKGTGKKPWYQKELFEPAGRRSLGELAGHPIAELAQEWRAEPDPAWEKLAYHVRRAWPRAEVIERGADLVPELVASIRQLLPLLDEINT
jgi:hypothetical protein